MLPDTAPRGTHVRYGTIDDRQLDAFCRIQGSSFGSPPDRVRRWVEVAGMPNLRGISLDGQLVAGLMITPMGLFLGGASVPTWGIAGVGVDPSVRGRGVGTALMRGVLREAYDAGIALSALYASTRSLYRSVGYEVAGNHYQATLATELLRGFGRPAAWRRVADADLPALREAHRRFAAPRDGYADRGDYLWARIPRLHGAEAEGWVLDGDDGPAAWVFFHQQRATDAPWVTLSIVDLGYTSFASIARTIRLPVGFNDPVLSRLPELRYDVRLVESWLVRVTHLDAAVAARGWPIDGRLTVEVDDPELPENGGRRTFVVNGGRGTCVPGGTDPVALGARGLAAWFTGFAPPWSLVASGQACGPPTALQRMGAWTAGAPSMIDFF